MKKKIINVVERLDFLGIRCFGRILLYLLKYDPKVDTFPDMFEGYNEYHEKKQTGSLVRAKAIAEWIEPNSTILDLGAGDCVVARYLKDELNCNVVGVDVSNVSKEKCKKLGIDVEIMDLNGGLALKEGEEYDYVVMVELLEHLVRPHVILSESVKLAKKGVIVTIPNSGYYRWRIQLLKGYFPRQSQTHLHFWTVKDFGIYCRKLGIEALYYKLLPRSNLLLRNRFKEIFMSQQCWLLKPKQEKSVPSNKAPAGKDL